MRRVVFLSKSCDLPRLPFVFSKSTCVSSLIGHPYFGAQPELLRAAARSNPKPKMNSVLPENFLVFIEMQVTHYPNNTQMPILWAFQAYFPGKKFEFYFFYI